jgi:lysophospholipase L1-like esterase
MRISPRLILAIVAMYVVILHAIIGLLIWKTDIVYRARVRFGLAASNEFELDQRSYRAAHNYFQRIDQLMRKSPVVLLGDSIMQQLPPIHSTSHVLNLGLGGITALDLANSLHRYPSLDKASAIVVSIGINDLCIERITEAALGGRIGKIAAALPSEVRVVWSSILPVDPTAAHATCRIEPHVISKANAMILKSCLAMPMCSYSDGFSILADERGYLDRRFYEQDGIHLNRRGYEAWTDLLVRDLGRSVGRSS